MCEGDEARSAAGPREGTAVKRSILLIAAVCALPHCASAATVSGPAAPHGALSGQDMVRPAAPPVAAPETPTARRIANALDALGAQEESGPRAGWSSLPGFALLTFALGGLAFVLRQARSG